MLVILQQSITGVNHVVDTIPMLTSNFVIKETNQFKAPKFFIIFVYS